MRSSRCRCITCRAHRPDSWRARAKLGADYLGTFRKMWRLRNSVDSCDYDTRAFYSKIPLQRYWQRRRYRDHYELHRRCQARARRGMRLDADHERPPAGDRHRSAAPQAALHARAGTPPASTPARSRCRSSTRVLRCRGVVAGHRAPAAGSGDLRRADSLRQAGRHAGARHRRLRRMAVAADRARVWSRQADRLRRRTHYALHARAVCSSCCSDADLDDARTPIHSRRTPADVSSSQRQGGFDDAGYRPSFVRA